jgi:hypothetical protein
MPKRQDEVIHDQFINALTEQGLTVMTANHVSSAVDDNKDFSTAVKILGSNNRNVYFLVYQGKLGIMHLHVRSEGSGFWGLTKNTLDHIKAFKEGLKVPNWLILLVGRQDKFIADGYIVSEVGTLPMRRPPTLLANGTYKINEKSDLNSDEKILSIKLIARQLEKLILGKG